MTLGQAFEAWAQMIRDERERLKVATSLMEEINMGATAIGTGINAHPAYSGLVIYELNQLTGLHLRPSPNLIMATQDTGAFLNFSSFLKNCCVRLSKISNDLRLLSSGPRCGLGEFNLPAVQPGSSIMPGKVNPVIPEVVNQTAFFVMGADFANTMASEAGQMELNAMEPLMAFLIFQSVDMISSAIATLIRNCIIGITPNVEKCTWYVMNSTGIVTALNPYIGYDNAARIAKTSLKTGKRVYDLVLEEKLLSKDQLDEIMQPDKMTKPREISKNKHWRKLSNTLESVSFFFKELENKKKESEQKA
jgi:aspartate ammonia-lyase